MHYYLFIAAKSYPNLNLMSVDFLIYLELSLSGNAC